MKGSYRLGNDWELLDRHCAGKDACLNDQICADFRAALDEALTAAEAGGLAAEVQMTLMLSELGRLIAGANDGEFEVRLAYALNALDHAARTALRDIDDPPAEGFVKRLPN